MQLSWKLLTGLSLTLVLAVNLLSRPQEAIAQSPASGVALAPATTKDGSAACWIAVGNKLYYVEKDDTTVLKVKASGAL